MSAWWHFFPDNTTYVFVAELTQNIINRPEHFHILFDRVVLNIGGAYNSRHVFTAKIPGVYHFAMEITFPPQSSSYTMHIRMMKKDKPVAITLLDNNSHQYLRRMCCRIWHLGWHLVAIRKRSWVKYYFFRKYIFDVFWFPFEGFESKELWILM